jgi:DNA-binding NarL/FixJ family response regulator
MEPIRILIVDDEELVLSSIEYMFHQLDDMRVAATARNGQEALQQLEHQAVDIVLLDMQMPVMDGLAFIRHIRATGSQLPILVLTTFQEKEAIVQALASGANGYLLKGVEKVKLLQSIRDVLNHQFILPTPIAAKLSQYLLETAAGTANIATPTYRFPTDMFTKKEQEILLLLSSRMRNKEIARQCHISEGTLANYLTIIFTKLDVKNRYDAVQAIQAYRQNAAVT